MALLLQHFTNCYNTSLLLFLTRCGALMQYSLWLKLRGQQQQQQQGVEGEVHYHSNRCCWTCCVYHTLI